MTIQSIAKTLAGMVAGECRWVGHEGIHVYCHGSRVDGKYDPRRTVFKVVTGTRAHDDQPWIDLLTAAGIVKAEVQS